MLLCMFHPNDNPLERGWVGRVDGERVLHLAAQTLQSLFLNGGTAREHAEYARADVTLLAPVQYPPTVRLFDADGSFQFANATAVAGDGTAVAGSGLTARARLAAVIGAAGEIGGTTALLEWLDPTEEPAVKQSDFCLLLGPAVLTPDEIVPGAVSCRLAGDGRELEGIPDAFSWRDAIAIAGRRTVLRPGDVIAGPPLLVVAGLSEGVELTVDGVGTLACPIG
jgi:hypothetical protein